MRKLKDEMRAEYKRSDFMSLERGRFQREAGCPAALLDPALAKALPTSEAVNEALLTLAQQTARIAVRSKRPARKRASA